MISYKIIHCAKPPHSDWPSSYAHTTRAQPPPPYSGGGVWSIELQEFSRTMTGRCLASGCEAERQPDTVYIWKISINHIWFQMEPRIQMIGKGYPRLWNAWYLFKRYTTDILWFLFWTGMTRDSWVFILWNKRSGCWRDNNWLSWLQYTTQTPTLGILVCMTQLFLSGTTASCL